MDGDTPLTLAEFVQYKTYTIWLWIGVLILCQEALITLIRWITRQMPILDHIHSDPMATAIYHGLTGLGIRIGFGLIAIGVLG